MTDYLFVELPWILERWRRKEARRDLMTMQIHNVPYVEERDREEFIEMLRVQAYGGAIDDDEFDAEGLAALRESFGGRI